MKIILILFLLLLSTICIFIVDKDGKNNVSLAQASSSSDLQLMARAINGEARGEPYEGVYKAARDAMNGWDPTGGCVYYFNPSTATNKWIWSRPLVKTIGKHRFCK